MQLIPNGITVKPIKDAKNYLAFADGRIYSLKNKRFIGVKEPNGYWRVTLPENHKFKHHLLSVLVYETFGDLPDDYSRQTYDIHHLKTLNDNQIWNLKCLSKKEHRNIKEHRQKISEKLKGHLVFDETREKLRKFNLGKTHSKEIKEKISSGNKGKKRTKIAKKNYSLSKMGEKNPSSKIKDSQRKEIIIRVIFLHNKGYSLSKSFRKIANDYPISEGGIRQIWYKWKEKHNE